MAAVARRSGEDRCCATLDVALTLFILNNLAEQIKAAIILDERDGELLSPDYSW